MPKILFIASHRPDRSPSQRFRFEQYLDFFKANGFDYDYSWFISEKHDRIFYSPGNIFTKGMIFGKNVVRRLKDVMISKHYDIIFVQREAFLTGSTYFEKKFAHSKAKLIFDFDDAIWMLDVSAANKKLGWLKNPQKTSKIISLANLVIAGNDFLADYAKQFNKNVIVIPTTVDTDRHKKILQKKNNDRVCIGWTGSLTTIKHFESATRFLFKIKEKYGDKVYFKVIGDESYVNEKLGVKGHAWKSETEAEDMAEFDIGIMTLPNDEWAKGKCGLKALTYMSMEIPTVLSAVGVNKEIISDGVNGFLAGNDEEWIEKLSKLIDDPDLRERIGKEGRKIVIEKYSVGSQKQIYLEQFKKLLR